MLIIWSPVLMTYTGHHVGYCWKTVLWMVNWRDEWVL